MSELLAPLGTAIANLQIALAGDGVVTENDADWLGDFADAVAGMHARAASIVSFGPKVSDASDLHNRMDSGPVYPDPLAGRRP